MAQDPGTLFIEKMLEEAGLTDLPADYKQEYIAKLQEQLNRRIGIVIMQNLSDEDAEKFAQMIEQSPAPGIDQMQSYFAEKIPDLEGKIKEGLTQFAVEFINASKK